MEPNYNEEFEKQILLKAKSKARWNTIIVIFSILLLFLPISYLSTVIFYSVNNKANDQILAIETVYTLTDPSLRIDDNKVKNAFTPLLGLNIKAPLLKRYGTKIYEVGEYSSSMGFGKAFIQYNRMNIPRPKGTSFPYELVLNEVEKDSDKQWDSLGRLPKGTIVEAFFLLDQSYSPKRIHRLFANKTINILWNAVDTGIESKMLDSEGAQATLIGFPTENKAPENSTFRETNSAEELFKEQLKFLKNHQEMVDNITGQQSIAAGERLSYIKKNGVKVYGLNVVGPVEEILKNKSNNKIKGIKIEDIGTWEWSEN